MDNASKALIIAGAILIDVNPFDQPGVEKYKELIKEALNNIFIF